MGRIATVVSTKRLLDEGVQVVEILVDTGGGNNVTVDHFDGAGEDALPLPGDLVALEEGDGTGNLIAVAYHDSKNAGKAANGEKRFVARKADGTIVSELWLKGDGAIEVNGLVNGGALKLDPSNGTWSCNGVTFDKQGNIVAPGEVTGMAATPATAVKLSTHLHPTGTGPSGPPQPGT